MAFETRMPGNQAFAVVGAVCNTSEIARAAGRLWGPHARIGRGEQTNGHSFEQPVSAGALR